jgi:phosphoheptose isomerase
MNTNVPDSSGIAPTPLLDEPDAHGQAALLLAESTLHSLIEAGVLTTRDAILAVKSAAEVKVEVAAITGESRGRMQESLDLLSRIEASLETDTAISAV